MTKWRIYDKSGNVLHESNTEYNGDGKEVLDDSPEYSGKWMGDCFLTVSIKSPYPINFQIGDYIVYRDEKFVINYDPSIIKKSSRGSYGEGFVYDNIKFNAISYELTDVKFHDWVLAGNKIHYSSLPNFSFYATDFNDLVDRLQACTDRWCKDNGISKNESWIFFTPGSNGDTHAYDRTMERVEDIIYTHDGSNEDTDENVELREYVLKRWKEIYGDDGSNVNREDELVDKNVSVDNQTVWDGMGLIKSQFGLNFIVRSNPIKDDDGNITGWRREVIVASAGIFADHLFKYGKNNGLYEIERNADTDQKVVTRLHAYGSSDNLPSRYYAELDMKIVGAVDEIYWQANHEIDGNGYGWSTTYLTWFSLNIPFKASMFNKATYYDGINATPYDEPYGYIVKVQVEDGPTVMACVRINSQYGTTGDKKKEVCLVVRLNENGRVKDFDWQNTDKDAFDSFSDSIASGKKVIFVSGINKDLAPVESMDYSGSKLPDNMAINNLMLPGFPKYSLAELCTSTYDEATDTTSYSIKNPNTGKTTVFHTESGKHLVSYSEDQYDPYIVSQNAETIGYRDDDIFCTEENDDNGLKKVYPSVEEVTEAEAGVSSSTDYINTIVEAETIKDNGVFSSKTSTKIPGFQVKIKNLGFELDDAIADAGGESCKISMKDGFCGGREFEVANVSKNSDGTWTLNCKRSQDSNLDIYYPYSYNTSIGGEANASEPYQICKGDKYVLTGISMSDTNYVWAASVKLLRKAIHWLCKNDYTRYTYSPKIDDIFMARQEEEAKSKGEKSLHDELKEGDRLWFKDDDLLIDGKVYIDQLTIKENGNNGIPTYEITLRNDVEVGTIQRIQNKVDSISNDIKSGNVAGGVSTSAAELIAKAVGDSNYLSKTSTDTAQKLITFLGGLKVGDGTYGITKDGIATLAGAVAEYIRSTDFNAGTGKGFDGTGYGITRDNAGKYTLEIDNIVARMKMIVAQLEVHEMSFIGGTIVLSPCGNKMSAIDPLDADGKVITDASSTPDRYRCYFLATDGSLSVGNRWTVGQLARCQTNNITAPGKYSDYANRNYWRLVVGVSKAPVERQGKTYHWIDLSNSTSGSITLTDDSGTVHIVEIGGVYGKMNSVPQENDCVVGMGHQWDTDRQDVAIIGADGWTLYKGIDHYDLPKANIINKFGIDETIVTTDHFTMRPYAQPDDTQTALCYRGAYDDKKYYGHNDLVSLDAQTWIASGVKAGDKIQGQKPSADSPYWSIWVAKGTDGTQGDAIDITFRLNGQAVTTLNFDTIKAMEGSDVTFEADFTNNGKAYNAARAVIGCYDADGQLMGSTIEVTNADGVVADGGNLYLSKDCKNIVCTIYDSLDTKVKEAGLGIIRNGTDATELVELILKLTDGTYSWRDGQGHVATITAYAVKGNYDITDAQDGSQFVWTRESDDTQGDKDWNGNHGAGSKTLDVSDTDMAGTHTSFICTLHKATGEAVEAKKLDFKL